MDKKKPQYQGELALAPKFQMWSMSDVENPDSLLNRPDWSGKKEGMTILVEDEENVLWLYVASGDTREAAWIPIGKPAIDGLTADEVAELRAGLNLAVNDVLPTNQFTQLNSAQRLATPFLKSVKLTVEEAAGRGSSDFSSEIYDQFIAARYVGTNAAGAQVFEVNFMAEFQVWYDDQWQPQFDDYLHFLRAEIQPQTGYRVERVHVKGWSNEVQYTTDQQLLNDDAINKVYLTSTYANTTYGGAIWGINPCGAGRTKVMGSLYVGIEEK